MTPSIFAPLRATGLTTLRARHAWRTGRTWFQASREWGGDLDFATYATAFSHESLLTATGQLLDDVATRELYATHGAAQPLVDLHELMTAGRHQGVDIWFHAGREIGFISNMHSNVRGIGNGRHAIRAGGIRRHERSEPEHEIFVDGLNLARAMTFKNAGARIPYGGSKICVVADPIGLDDAEALGFLGWCIDRSRCFTGPDMGLLPDHADALRARFTRNIVGGPGGALGPTGKPTADGVLLALEIAAKHHLGRRLATAAVALQGLGAVGAPLAQRLLEQGVPRLLVADADPERVVAFREALPPAQASRVQVVEPDRILYADVDIVSPNAVGGVLGDAEIALLRCRVVMGAANNQLRASSQAEELRLADALAARGVLYQADWMHNAAGVIAGREEWEHQEEASMARVVSALEVVCGEGVRSNLEAARDVGLTPTAMAYKTIEDQIYR